MVESISWNTVDEIKEQLLLESENQTISNDTIQTYLNNAHKEVFQSIKRNYERDNFTVGLNPDGSTQTDFFVTLSPINTVIAVLKNNTELDSESYEVIIQDSGVRITSPSYGDVYSVLYVPDVYILYERAICILKLMTRFNPFTDDNNQSTYYQWKKTRDSCYNQIRSNFGTSCYSSS